MVEKSRAIRLLQRLIRAKSENPPGEEKRAAEIVKKEMEKMGLEVKTYEFAKDRPNIIGIWKGKRKKEPLSIITHIDVVPAGNGWSIPPYRGVIRGWRIYGRGASDCKVNVAASLEAVHSLKEDGFEPEGDVIIVVTADEEAGSHYGLKPLLENKVINSKNILILDGANFNIIIAQKGLFQFKVKIYGEKAHGAYPFRGINAIEQAAKIITELKEHKFSHRRHKLFKEPTVNIGKINGGEKVNIVADYCEFEVDLRFLPTMNVKEVEKEVRKIIEKTTKKYEIEVLDVQKPYEINKNNSIVKKLANTMKKCGKRINFVGLSGASQLSFFDPRKVNAVGTGFGNLRQAHATNEYVMIKNLVDGTKVVEKFVRDFWNE